MQSTLLTIPFHNRIIFSIFGLNLWKKFFEKCWHSYNKEKEFDCWAEFFGVSSSPPLCTHEICAIVCKFFFSLLIFFSSIKFIWFHKKGPHKLIKGRITTISFSLSFHARHLPGAKKLHFLRITIFCVPRSESTCLHAS